MAKKRKPKRATIKRRRKAKKSKRTANKSKAKRSKLKEKWSKPSIDIFRPDIADEELERAAGSGRLESVIPGLAVTDLKTDCCR